MQHPLRHITACLLLALYLPLAVALPLFHNHGPAFGATRSYTAPGTAAVHDHDHHGDCFACKFTSSHSPSVGDGWLILPSLPVRSAVIAHRPMSTAPTGLNAPRAPPGIS